MTPKSAAGAVAVLLLAITVLTAEQLRPVRRHTTFPPCTCGIPHSNYQYGSRSRSETVVSRTAVLLRRGTRVAEAIGQTPRVLAQGEYIDSFNANRVGASGEVYRDLVELPPGHEHFSPAGWHPMETRVERLPPPKAIIDVGTTTSDFERSAIQRTFRNPFSATPPLPEPMRQTVIDLYQLDRAGLIVDHCEISEVALQLHSNGQWVLSFRADQNRRPEEDEPVVYNPSLHIRRNQFVVRLRCLGAFQTPSTEVAPSAGKPVLAELHVCPFWVENGQPRYVRTGGFDDFVFEHFRDIDRVEIEFFYR